MRTEFNVLCKYLRGGESCDDYIRELYEAKYGQVNLNYYNSLWIIIYLKDMMSVVGLYKNLNAKLLFLLALLEVSPAHKDIFPEKQSKLLLVIISPFLMIAFLISLFVK